MGHQVLYRRLSILQRWLAISYALSLPLSMTASWVLLTAGVLCCLVELTTRRTPALFQLPLIRPLLVLVAAVGISGLANGGIGEACRSIISLKGMLAFLWSGYLFGKDRQTAVLCLRFALITAAIGGIWGTVQQIFNVHFTGFHYLQGTGFLGGPMAFAGQMQIFSMLALALLFTGNDQCLIPFAKARLLPRVLSPAALLILSRVLFIIITIANLMGLVFAGERSAWLGGLAGTIVLAGLISWRLLIKCLLAIILIISLSWWTVPLVHTRIQALFSGQQDVSTRVRFQVWHTAIEEWDKSPLLGIGFLKFPHLDIPEAIVPGKSKDINHAHSNYLQMLSTTGITGLFAYLGLCLAQLHAGFTLLKKSKQNEDRLVIGTSCGILAAMVSLMVSGAFEYNFGTAQVRLAQWFMLGLLGLKVK